MLHVALHHLGQVRYQIEALFEQDIDAGKGVGHLVFLAHQVVVDQDQGNDDDACNDDGDDHDASISSTLVENAAPGRLLVERTPS